MNDMCNNLIADLERRIEKLEKENEILRSQFNAIKAETTALKFREAPPTKETREAPTNKPIVKSPIKLAEIDMGKYNNMGAIVNRLMVFLRPGPKSISECAKGLNVHHGTITQTVRHNSKRFEKTIVKGRTILSLRK